LYSKFQANITPRPFKKQTLTPTFLVTKTQEIISNSYVHNSFNILYIPTTNSETINENSIKKRVTARSHDLLSDSISALFGGTEKKHKKKPPLARIASLSQDLNLDC